MSLISRTILSFAKDKDVTAKDILNIYQKRTKRSIQRHESLKHLSFILNKTNSSILIYGMLFNFRQSCREINDGEMNILCRHHYLVNLEGIPKEKRKKLIDIFITLYNFKLNLDMLNLGINWYSTLNTTIIFL